MTIAENIAYGRDLSSELDMDRVRSAAVAAYADASSASCPRGTKRPSESAACVFPAARNSA